MPHIHTAPDQHDQTVTAYIVRIDTPEPRALLHMHRKLHILLPVGGHVELLETPWRAMAHELAEESGYRLDQLEILQPKSRIRKMTRVVQHPYPLALNTHDIPGRHFHSDIDYGLIAKGEPALAIGGGESADLRWLSAAEIQTLTQDEIFESTKEVYRFIFDEALANWDRVAAGEFLLDFPDEFRLP